MGNLAEAAPLVAAEWHPTKNGELSPADVARASKKKVWWVCPRGHEYQAVVGNRTTNGTTCSVCANRVIVAGINDLSTLNPAVAAEWHPLKNEPLTASSVAVSSHKKVWWICPEGHEFKATIANRSHNYSRCPVCSNRAIIPGLNDLASLAPNIAAEWHPSKNGELKPSEVAPSSGKRVWWLCSSGHEYQVSISQRNGGGRTTGCPYCAGNRILEGFNDLQTMRPDIAAEWHPTKNGELKPSEAAPTSHKRVWWLCSTDSSHEWTAAPADRTGARPYGCAICSNKQIQVGANDLATTHPELGLEWHPTKNGPLRPDAVTWGSSSKKVWWLCDRGHEWRATPNTRTNSGNGCPVCSNQMVLEGFNDLQTMRPDIAAEWHPTKNGDRTPSMVLPGTNSKAWWTCPNDETHFYLMDVGARSSKRASGCPKCAKTGFDSTMPGTLYVIEHEDLGARKVGITNGAREHHRLRAFQRRGWRVLATIESERGEAVLELETRTLRWIRGDLHLPRYLDAWDIGSIGGASETFSAEGISEAELLSGIQAIANELGITRNVSR